MNQDNLLNTAVDAESAEFIEWAFKGLQDDRIYKETLDEALERANTYFHQSKDQFLSKLRAKMTIGAVEHGAPSHPLDRIQHELEGEYIDLIGWLLVEKWNKRKIENHE